MLTLDQFNQIEEFVANAALYDHLYGTAIVYNADNTPIGSYLLNTCKNEDCNNPIDYFISGENINDHHYSHIGNIVLNKRLTGSFDYITLSITANA